MTNDIKEVELYHLWMPKEIYDTVSTMSEIKKVTINKILVTLLKEALGHRSLKGDVVKVTRV